MARVARQTKTCEYKDLDAHFTANLGYSHHQKSITMDADPRVPCQLIETSEKETEKSLGATKERRIVAFVGGIDLTGEKCLFYAL